MKFKKEFLPLIIFIIIISTLFVTMKLSNKEDYINVSNTEITSIYDEKINLKEFEGNFYLIHVFATWCNICKKDLFFLSQIKNDYNIEIIGLAMQDNIAKLRALNHVQLPYKFIALDDKFNLVKKLGVRVLPETFLIDQNGNVVLHLIGGLNSKRITSQIKPIIRSHDR
jgi:cytochrome c biogenesis protein CcmG, thiol:disulfide interchange protein DsbE